ncbi:tetratricopeptide repeat protein [Undibacterium sp. Di24W]|uniref:tetratricopeptide repeat protein n=1 Tax=Undibacterium sp. Di24W TaxID=3413033 RepID=UPI003BF0DDA2
MQEKTSKTQQGPRAQVNDDSIQQALRSHQAGKLAEAADLYQRLLLKFPEDVEVLTLLASLRMQEGLLDVSEALFKQALNIDKKYLLAQHNYAMLLKRLERFEQALAHFDAVILLNPQYEVAYKNRDDLLILMKRKSDAIDALYSALDYVPESIDLRLNLSKYLHEDNRSDEALVVINRALELQPDRAVLYNARGCFLSKLGRTEQAIADFHFALKYEPLDAAAHNNLAIIYRSQHRFDEAIAEHDAIVKLGKETRIIEANRGRLYLLLGRFLEGWSLFESRIHVFKSLSAELARFPKWHGQESLKEKAILLHPEQGYGDTIQFLRYANLVAQQSSKVYLAVPEPLFDLVAGSVAQWSHGRIIEVITDLSSTLNFHWQTPLMSLPFAFKTELHNIPMEVPYLFADRAAIEKWRVVLGQKTKPRLGLVWSGSNQHGNDMNRSIPLSEFSGIFSAELLEKFELHSLKNELDARDDSVLLTLPIRSHHAELVNFTETAALIEAMDLIITVDTSVAHLAGALGKPTWILLPHVPDFRWLLEREDSPWYPSVKLFRQVAEQDWTSVFVDVRSQLQHISFTKVEALPFSAPKVIMQGNQKDIHRMAVQQALFLHQAGNLDSAKQAYLELLQAYPNNDEILTLLASLHMQEDRLDLSESRFEESLRANTNNLLAHHNFAMLLKKLGRNVEALEHFNLAIEINPEYETAYKNRDDLLIFLGRQAEAIISLQCAVKCLPQAFDLYLRLSKHLREQKRFDEALSVLDQAQLIRRDYAPLYNARGSVQLELKQAHKAIHDYQTATQLNPEYAKAFGNLGLAYMATNQFKHALDSFDRALMLDPSMQGMPNNRANALQNLHRFDEALAGYDAALERVPNDTIVLANKGVLCLLLGRFDEGWPLYEARWKNLALAIHPEVLDFPVWMGQGDIQDKIITLHPEQGYGDTLQFCRYAALVARLCKKVYLVVNTPLLNLLSYSIAQWSNTENIEVIGQGVNIPSLHLQTPLLSLPLAFKTTIDNIPCNVPYIFCRPTMAQEWLHYLGPKLRPRIGLAWAGSSQHTNNANRSLDLSELVDVLRKELRCELDFHCLQKELSPKDELDLAALSIHTHQKKLGDFSDTAALVEAMDIVITVDTSIAHLAGGLGKTTWVMLAYVPDFRWLLEREDSPWYPSAKLFRQHATADWKPVLTSIALELNQLYGAEKPRNLKESKRAISLNDRGNEYVEQGLYKQAIEFFNQALAINPNNSRAQNNLGVALQKNGEPEAALIHFNRAISLDPGYVSPNLNKAMLLLSLGDFAEGWRLYEWRWKNAQWKNSIRHFKQDLWLGDQAIQGKKLFVYAEQGIGDCLQFSRLINALVASGVEVIAEVPESIFSLMQSVDAKVSWQTQEQTQRQIQEGTLPEFDYYCPLLSLPLALRIEMAELPQQIPYLSVDLSKQTIWHQKLVSTHRPKIGVVWSGSRLHLNDKNRSIPFETYVKLMQVDLDFYVLQKETSKREVTTFKLMQSFGKKIHCLQTEFSDFSDTAALINELDLVISVDTSVAHLAGALGKPVWILLPKNSDFRWLLEREDSPWYPTARLFRQTNEGDWDEVVKRVLGALQERFF